MTGCVAGLPAVDPALVARFSAALERLNPDGGKIGLAVSGGPDSMAMLLLAQEAIPGSFEVATVDHGLRPEAKDECALVMAACEARGVPCEVLTVQVGKGNVQARAREARYMALGEWRIRRWLGAVATAHHADDQAETILMRLNRGSGVSGLAGVREKGSAEIWPDGLLLRPLLYFRRQELAEICEAASIEVANDPSNEDERFDRVRIRNALAEADWLDPIALTKAAANLADADEALWNFMFKLWDERVDFHQGATPIDRVYKLEPGIGTEMEIRLIARIFGELGKSARGSDYATLVEKLRKSEQLNVGGVLATVECDKWVFRPEPPRRTG